MHQDQRKNQRREQVSGLIQQYMQRAGVNDTDLARRTGLNRIAIRRLRVGESMPQEKTIRLLKSGLRWQDDTGIWRELTNDELTELHTAAGYYEPELRSEADSVERPDRCIIYSNRYSPDAFPSRWSERIIELERSMPGSIYTMCSGLPSITRNPDFYRGAYQGQLYNREKVEAYMLAHKKRQAAFLQRLEVSRVCHLYCKREVESFLSGASRGERPEWDIWPLSKEVRAKQLGNLLEWLETYDNFEVRLREIDVLVNAMILAQNIVLVEFPRTTSLRTTVYINGLELVGSATSVQFTNQFDGFWADRETVKDRNKVIAWLKQIEIEK